MNDSRLLLALILFGACGPSERSDEPATQPDAAPPRCTDGSSTTTVMVSSTPTTSGYTIRSWTLDAIAGSTSVIAHRQHDSDGSMRAAILDDAGATELAAIPDAGPYQFDAAAITMNGTSCAAFASSRGGMFLGCKGAAAESANLDNVDGDPLFPFVRSDGALSVFTQSYASFTELRRSASGQWSEIEQYESSISYPTDVVGVDGFPVVCFISNGDRAVIKSGSTELVSMQTTNTCKLAVDASTLHVLTDDGYKQIPLATFAGGTFDVAPVPALGMQRVSKIFLSDGAAFALAYDSDMVKVTPLSGGEPIVVGMASEGSSAIAWDDAAGAVRIVTSKLDTSGDGPMYPQSITFETHCMP